MPVTSVPEYGTWFIRLQRAIAQIDTVFAQMRESWSITLDPDGDPCS